jgi:hypothetical protein
VDQTKIQFSDAEMKLMCDRDIILTKNKVIAGIIEMFSALQNRLREHAPYFHGLENILQANPKITRGENYLGLPFVILDYPRHFDGKNIFAIRTMFWWGNFFSVTLHLAGEEKKKLLPAIENAYGMLAGKHFFINVNEDPWQHHFEETNYIPVGSLSAAAFINYCSQHEHLKIAMKWPVKDVNLLSSQLEKSWQLIMEITEKNAQS